MTNEITRGDNIEPYQMSVAIQCGAVMTTNHIKPIARCLLQRQYIALSYPRWQCIGYSDVSDIVKVQIPVCELGSG